MTQNSRARRALAALAVTSLLLAAASPTQAAPVDLADAPLFSSVTVPGNLLLALSVEFPTASTAAYSSTTAYATATEFSGYFDPNKCYTYNYNSTTPALSYFVPNSAASTHVCVAMWSGNWLNWASMQGLDEFRWVLTGGNRTQDTSSLTVLTKTYHSGQSSSGNTAQNKSIASSPTNLITGATPILTSGTPSSNNWTSVVSRTAGTGIMMLISNSASATAMGIGTASSPPTTPATYTPSSANYTNYTGSGAINNSTVYALYMNVQVCASALLKESNCVLYGTNTYKPEGLMQAYSSQFRYAAMGYLSDPSISDTPNEKRDGGVLRARMNYVGPTQPVAGATPIANTLAEWSSSTGIMAPNPDATDASNTLTGGAPAITQSGVMNYLNKFGYAGQLYKTYDPVGELYYAAIRYFKNQAPVAAYSSLTTDSTAQILLDGFPVIITSPTTAKDDPILYSCQKNFILGIGDTNTNYDADLPGSTLISGSIEPTMPTEVTNDTTINVATSTNAIGQEETGSSGLAGSKNGNGTYYIGGLAYDAHVKGVRTYTDTSGNVTVATVNTYWLDVLEGQTYAPENQYYYATKYGGFAMPDGSQPLGYGTIQKDSTGAAKSLTLVNPYPSSYTQNTVSVCNTTTGACGTGSTTASLAIPTTGSATNAMWHTNTDLCKTTSACSATSGDYRPDNYYTANNAAAMKAGLTTAFAKISSEAAAANTTAISTPTVNVASTGAVSYGATYDPSNWTGKLTASTVTFDSSGVPTVVSKWDARQLISASTVTATSRKIVTCCTSAGAGLTFEDSTLSASGVTANYASFGAVPGVTSQSRVNFLAYLRGDTTKELTPNGSGVYRDRAFRLGDIVDSKPVAVGAPSATYVDSSNAGYSTFKSTYSTRGTVVYVGANDGMLHAFDGTTTGNGGQEVFAYVPSFVYGNGTSSTSGTTSTTILTATTGIALLGNPTFTHHYFVDATPGQFDVDLNNTKNATTPTTSATNSDWRTLLIGGLGKGGTGYYALDITKADTYDGTTGVTEANIAKTVMWEFTDTHMGYTYGTPSVVKTAKYGWVVVMTSGYNNDNGIGYFYFVDPRTGKVLETVATPTGSLTSPINMGQHTAYVPDYTDGTADAIYGVDMQGDVWRLDVTGSPSSYPTPKLIATLKDSSGLAQPITTRPLIEPDTTSSARYVMVGTGRLLGNSDISSTTSNTQSFYAIIDGTSVSGGFFVDGSLPTAGKSFPVTRTDLNNNTDLTAGITAAATTIGWYYDMPVTTTTDSSGVHSYIAQRVNVDPVATQGVIAWAGNLPNGSSCSPSGTGTTYATAFSTGRTVLIDSNGATASISNTAGLITELSFINSSGTINLYSGDSSGGITKDTTQVITTSGPKQLNWRDVPLAN